MIVFHAANEKPEQNKIKTRQRQSRKEDQCFVVVANPPSSSLLRCRTAIVLLLLRYHTAIAPLSLRYRSAIAPLLHRYRSAIAPLLLRYRSANP